MLPSSDAIRASFERIAACGETVETLDPTTQRLVNAVPLRARVLEIGCGTGMLARELATRRGAKVTAIDLSPRMIDVARVRSSASLGIEYRVADFLALSPRGFDVVIAVNTLHHLPLATAAASMALAVVPGGQVLVADRFTAHGVSELPYSGISWLIGAPPDAPGEHGDIATLGDVRRQLRAVMPGVAVRRHLGWRYTAAWRRP